MMKNILIVLTVLAMASVANAALLISVDGVVDPPDTSIEIRPSDIVIIDVYNDAVMPQLVGFLTVTGQATVDLTNAVNFINPQFPPFDMGIIDPMFAGIIQVDLTKAGVPIPDIPVGTMADGIALHCDAEPGDVTISLWDAPMGGNLLDVQVIHQIPEPITFALLGLGGLFLRRRK